MSQPSIFIGKWINHSHQGAYASTWTLPVQKSAIVIAAAAAFITIVGSSFWTIIAFAIHQCRVSSFSEPGVHYQHQAIYRADLSPTSTFWQLLKITWAWRNRVRRNWLRFLGLALPPLICFGGFTAASILSSAISAPSYVANQVLLRVNNCGFRHPSNTTAAAIENYNIGLQRNARYSRDYARSCYTGQDRLDGCSLYPVRQLEYSIATNASCPFIGAGTCSLGGQNALKMSTVWLDSNEHFGINEPLENRIQFRKVATCAPIAFGQYVQLTNNSGYPQIVVNLGPIQGLSTYTFLHNPNAYINKIGYQITPIYAYANSSENEWAPIAPFDITDADVTLFYIRGNAIQYKQPVTDPVFRTKPLEGGSENITDFDFPYLPNVFGGIIGCTEQYQVRNPTTQVVTPLDAIQATQRHVSSWLVLNGTSQISNGSLASSGRLTLPSIYNNLFNAVYGLGEDALLAQQSVFGLLSFGLPQDQWIREARGWFETALAGLQSAVVEFASKQTSPSWGPESQTTLPAYDALLRQCGNQKVRNVGAYQNFSVLGLGIIAGIGGAIVLLASCLSGLVQCIRRRTGRQQDKTIAWQTDSVLQLQRVAFQAYGLGTWEKLTGDIPVTAKGELLQSPFIYTEVPKQEELQTWQGPAEAWQNTSAYGYSESFTSTQQMMPDPSQQVHQQQYVYGQEADAGDGLLHNTESNPYLVQYPNHGTSYQ